MKKRRLHCAGDMHLLLCGMARSRQLGHLKCEHSLAIAVANLILSPLASVLPVGSAALQTNLLRWQRAAELTCDRAALLVVQDPRAVQATAAPAGCVVGGTGGDGGDAAAASIAITSSCLHSRHTLH